MRRLLAAATLALHAACASTPADSPRRADLPTPNPHEKVGVPYKIKGQWYRPAHDPDYDETGVASWYGPNFHGKLTANGEIFDMNRLTAAHKTLPLPSLVRVTNTENGRSAVLRLNDRGPFAGERIIDLSRAAAERLGTRRQGLGRVRVEYLGPAPMEEAIVRLGEPEAYADGRYAAVAKPRVRGEPGVVPGTVRTRIEEGEELAPRDIEVDGIAIVVAEAEDAVVEIPLTPRPAREAAPTPSPKPAFPQARAGRWYVQVGAYADPGGAARASARLPEAVPIALATDETGLTRLRVGPYADEFPAREALRVAQSAGFADAAVIQAD